jgi:hypothetical protein
MEFNMAMLNQFKQWLDSKMAARQWGDATAGDQGGDIPRATVLPRSRPEGFEPPRQN